MEIYQKKMKERSFSSVVLWAVLLFFVYAFNTWAVPLLVSLGALFAQIEFSRLMQKMGLNVMFKFNVILAVIFPWLILFSPSVVLIYLLTFISICCISFGLNKRALLSTLLAFWYIPFNLHFFVLILKKFITIGNPLTLIIWVVLVTKMTDVGGLIIGCKFGKHPLLPSISPKKTWEGVAGGAVFALFSGFILTAIVPHHLPQNFHGFYQFICIFCLVVGAIFSDLLESLFKRRAHEKDSGRFIPGIGGALDLVDSLLLNAPLAYCLFSFL